MNKKDVLIFIKDQLILIVTELEELRVRERQEEDSKKSHQLFLKIRERKQQLKFWETEFDSETNSL